MSASLAVTVALSLTGALHALPIFLVGLTAGYVAGVIGVAMGAIAVPALILLGLPPTTAVGASLLMQVAVSPLGGITHLRQGNVNFRIFVPLLAAGVVGAVGGGIFSLNLNPGALALLIGAITATSGAAVLLRSPKNNGPGDELPGRVRTPTAGFVGAVAGFSTGAFGTGWGPIGIPCLILGGARPRQAVGSSLLARSFVALAGGLTLHFLSNLPLGVIVPLLLGGATSMLSGASLTRKVPPHTLRVWISLAVIVLGAVILVKFAF